MLVYCLALSCVLGFSYGQNITCTHSPKGHVITFDELGIKRTPCPNMVIAGECGKGKWSVTMTKEQKFRFAYDQSLIVMNDGETVEHPEVKVEIVETNAVITVPELGPEKLCGSCSFHNYVDVLCMQTFEVPPQKPSNDL